MTAKMKPITLKRAMFMMLPAALTFVVSSALLAPDAANRTPPTPELVRMVARVWEKVPKESWVVVDEQAWNRLRNADPLKKHPDDCVGLFEWAERNELSPSVPLQHLLTITAGDRAHIRLQNIYAMQGSGQSAVQRSPVARTHLTCHNKSGAEDAHELPEIDATTFAANERVAPRDLAEDYVFDMGKGAETALRLAVDSLPGSSRYDYDLIVNVEVDGSLRRFNVNNAGRPFQRR